MTSKVEQPPLTIEEEEDKLFANHYPHLNAVPEIYLDVIDQHRRKKNHLFYFHGNYQDLTNQRYPFNRYAPIILNEGAGPFHWIFVVRNSGKIDLMPIHDWEIKEGDPNGPRLMYETDKEDGTTLKDDDDMPIPILLTPNEIYAKFKKILIPKIEKSTGWLKPFFEDWLEQPKGFRIGDFGLVFLEFIDNLINGTYSDWYDPQLTKIDKKGYSVLVIFENASTFFSDRIQHSLPNYTINYAIDLFNKWKTESHARSSLIIVSERTRSGLIEQRILESLAPIEFPFPTIDIINDWIKFRINWQQAIPSQKCLSIPVPNELTAHFKNRKQIPLRDVFSEKMIQQLIPKCRGLSLIAIEDLLVSFKIDPKTKDIDIKQAIERKKQLIEQEFPGKMVELFEDNIQLDHVVLPKEQKDFIQRKIIRTIKNDMSPKGILLAGPSGTGKTLLAKAIASEAGILAIIFNISNVLSKFVGESESNFSKATQLFKASSPCIVIMDELDQQIKGRNANNNESDGNTSSRIRGMLLEFTSDPANDGVTFINMTNAPEALDYAATRSGRINYVIPILLPDKKQRIELLNLHLKLLGIDKKLIQEPATQSAINKIMADKEGVSGADIELMAKDTNIEWKLNDNDKLKFADVLTFAANDLNSSVRFTEDLTAASLTIASHISAIPIEYRGEAETLQLADKGSGGLNKHKTIMSRHRTER